MVRQGAVDPADGDDSDGCTQGAPCGTIERALRTRRPKVVVIGRLRENLVIDDGRRVTIVGMPGATLEAADPGRVVLEIRDPEPEIPDVHTEVRVENLVIHGGTSAMPAVLLTAGAPVLALNQVTLSGGAGLGLRVEGAARLEMSQSRLIGFQSGGIRLVGMATFAVVGNVLASNGGPDSPAGAIHIFTSTPPVPARNRFEFNTLVDNDAMAGTGSDIHCRADVVVARNNILRSPDRGDGAYHQVVGPCRVEHSLIWPGPVVAGTGNLRGAPRFADGELRLDPMSPAIGAADPAADLTGLAERDIDGNPRIAPADVGAYQRPRPAQ